jgi:hypothetical protein
MTNQAAQTMPELAADDPIIQMRMVVQTARANDALISRAWVSGWADQWEAERAAAMLAASPAASGGEGGIRDAYEGAREDLLDWKGRALRAEATLRGLGYTGICADEAPQPPSAASVSERARALLAAEFARAGMPFNAADCARGEVSPTYEPALRAIEQALTQQRGLEECDG